MIPCLFESDTLKYENNGLGKLSDCISCVVTEKRNDSYELEMEYPVSGIHADEIVVDALILAKPSVSLDEQFFRIYLVEKSTDGIIKVSARHVSYDLNFITSSGCIGSTALTSLTALKASATTDCNFTFSTDIDSTANFSISEPNSLRNILGGIEGSILDTYGGEFEWDNFKVVLHKSRGADNNVRIVYSKNIKEFQMSEDTGDLITGVHPYWAGTDDDDNDILIELPEKVIMASDATDYRIVVLDCSSEFDEEPSTTELRAYAKAYLESTDLVTPSITIDLDFASLYQFPGYEEIADAEEVDLCDTVYVYIPSLNIEVSSKVTETEYNVLLERYDSITVSNSLSSTSSLVEAMQSLATTVVDKKLTYYSTTHEMTTVIESALGSINLEIDETYATYAQFQQWSSEYDALLTIYYQTMTENNASIKMSLDSISSTLSSTTTTIESLETTTVTISQQISEISQTLQNITLYVTDSDQGTAYIYLSVDGEVTGNATSVVTSSRQAFANESSSVTIGAGVVTFTSNTFVVSSTNLSITSAGKLTCSGAEISGNITANNLKAYGNLYFYRTFAGTSDEASWQKVIDYTETSNSLRGGYTYNLYLGISSTNSTIYDATVLRGHDIFIYASTTDSTAGTIYIGLDTDYSNGNKEINIDGKPVNINTSNGNATNIGGALTVEGRTTVNAGIVPNTNASYALGLSASSGWSNIYIGNESNTTNGIRYILSSTNYNLLVRNSSNHFQLGNSTYALYIYGSTIYMNGSSYGSDRRIKEDIDSIDSKYESFFNSLQPMKYKFTERVNSDGEQIGSKSGRTHIGFVAQDVLTALEGAGLSSSDFAGYVDLNLDENDPDDLLCLRYEEFIALNTHMIQKLQQEVETLKEMIGGN